MRHILDQLDKPVIFAHRGASADAPENPLAAFELAVRMGAKAIELDTMLSKDGIPLVIHDHTLERTTNGQGFVSDCDLSELALLDAGSWYSDAYIGEKIPLLHEVLTRYSRTLLINIELKNYNTPNDNLTETVIKMVDKLDIWDSVLFSSFLPRNLKLVKNNEPEAKIALLCPSGVNGWLFRSSIYLKLSPLIIHPAEKGVNSKYIEMEHNRERRVHVWTVNDEARAKELFNNGIDGIFTDKPKAMQEVLRLINPR
jgi:glycerophosphoryl diester phosphodiesterase